MNPTYEELRAWCHGEMRAVSDTVYEAATKRDTWWHCDCCGDHEPAEAPYVLGDSEPCSTCGEGVARVMTLRDGARIESMPPWLADAAEALGDNTPDRGPQ